MQISARGGWMLAWVVLGLAVLFAYLFLVALYESWNVPVPALLSVSVGILGALVAVFIAGLSFDVYAQIGLVALIVHRKHLRHDLTRTGAWRKLCCGYGRVCLAVSPVTVMRRAHHSGGVALAAFLARPAAAGLAGQ